MTTTCTPAYMLKPAKIVGKLSMQAQKSTRRVENFGSVAIENLV